ncbi:MAG TPA: DUF5367 family protein [Vicinamibacterales bacterium]|nr:DUF5367 family protein [Vicinamibacterales bacterium]
MKPLVTAGFAIWLLATIALRLAGQWMVRPGAVGAIVLLAVSAPLMFRLPRGLFVRFRVDPNRYALGGIALVAPGMLLDAVSAIWFPEVFPNMSPEVAGLFGGWLLFCNVVALVSAATASPTRTASVERLQGAR